MFNAILSQMKGDNMEKPLKFVQVFEDTKNQIKTQAEKNNLSIRAYMQLLVDMDKKKNKW